MSDERSDGPRLMTAKKHDGSKGAAWEKWKTEYLDAAAGKGDDMASWADTFNGTDQQVGLTAAQVRARTKRRREAYSSLLLHLDDEGLKATIRAEAGGAANQGGNARIAMQVCDREMGEPTSALHVNEKILGMHSITLSKEVGRKINSLVTLNRLLTMRNEELPR